MPTPRFLHRFGAVYAIYKPAGLRVHPGADDGQTDLIAWLAQADGLPPDLRPVHRLDSEVSGVVLCAAEREARALASGWFESQEIKKTYLALVYGRTHKKGAIKRKLQDGRRGRRVDAVTRYWQKERFDALTLVRVRPETGRKHQIRRHLHGLGHPIVGDERYRPKRRKSVPGYPGRLWLHAWKLELPTGEEVVAPLPEALEAHLSLLRERRALRERAE